MKQEKIQIGKIVNAVALKGEVKVYNYSDEGRFDMLENILVEDIEYKIEKVRYQGNMVILKLKGVNDRNAAEALKNQYIYIWESDLPELDEDTYYIRDLIGMTIIDDNGTTIGLLCDVIQGTAQDLYEIKLKNGKLGYIPAVAEFVKDIDLDKNIITVKLIEGLLP